MAAAESAILTAKSQVIGAEASGEAMQATIDRIQAARVHLVLPERPLFSRETPEPSASIVLRVRGALERVDDDQANKQRNPRRLRRRPTGPSRDDRW